MTFEELQQEWKAVKSKPKTHDELRRMMYSSPGLRLRGLTEKEFIKLSFVALFVFILVVDGYINYVALSGLVGLVQVLDQYFALRYLRFLPHKDTLQGTLTNTLRYINRRKIISRINNVLIWIALVFILATSVQVGTMNILRWALILLPLLVAAIWWTSKTWSKKSDEVKALLRELSDDEIVPV